MHSTWYGRQRKLIHEKVAACARLPGPGWARLGALATANPRPPSSVRSQQLRGHPWTTPSGQGQQLRMFSTLLSHRQLQKTPLATASS